MMPRLTLKMAIEEHVCSDEAKQLLRDQTIDDDGPGTILRDFNTLLDFIGTDGLRSTGKYHFLPQGQLSHLNEMMSRPLAHSLKRPQQRSLPNLQGLYLILRSSEMGLGVGGASGGRLVLNAEPVDAWRALNATERYFALLDSWLIQGSFEVLGKSDDWHFPCIRRIIDVMRDIYYRDVAGFSDDTGTSYARIYGLTLALMELFGWIRLKYDKPVAGKMAKISTLELLPFGYAMANALLPFSFSASRPTPYGGQTVEPESLQPLFQPFFPEYERTLVPEQRPFRNSTYVWNVSLAEASRQIIAPAKSSLDTLAMTILEAFEFDDDHLYCFELRQTNGRMMQIACPYEHDAVAFTDEVRLGDLAIEEGSTMTMIFDYGAEWQFDILLQQISTPDKKLKKPRVTAKQGKPPAQYEWYDEDEEEEE